MDVTNSSKEDKGPLTRNGHEGEVQAHKGVMSSDAELPSLNEFE